MLHSQPQRVQNHGAEAAYARMRQGWKSVLDNVERFIVVVECLQSPPKVLTFRINKVAQHLHCITIDIGCWHSLVLRTSFLIDSPL